jgi:hypothetical protein
MSKKKMRQPTPKELKKGKIAGTAFGGQRALTPGDKEGEMIYSRPDYSTGKTRVQVTSGVKGGRGTKNPPRVKPTPSKGQIHSAANKEKIDKAAKAADKRSAEANKYNPTKEEMVGSKNKRPATFGEIGKRQKKEKDIDKGFETIAIKTGGNVHKKYKSTVKKIKGTPAEERRSNKQQKMMGMPEEGDYVPIIEAPKGPIKTRAPGRGKEDPSPTERGSKLLKSLKRKKGGSTAVKNKKKSQNKGTGIPKSMPNNKRKLIEQQEDYATMGDRGLVSNILGFSPIGEIGRGISNLISDDKGELEKIRKESSEKATSDLDTGFKGMAAPYQPSDFEKKSGGGKVYNKKHGGKTITSKMSGQDVVNACYD